MVSQKSSLQLVVGLIAVVMLAAACFQQVGDVPQSNAVSERSSETPTNTPSPTEEPSSTPTEEQEAESQAVDQPMSDVVDPEGTSVAQSGSGSEDTAQQNQPDPFQLTATELIRTATQGVEMQMTETAIALGLGATETPTETSAPTLDPLAIVTPTTFISGTDCVHEVRTGETMYRLSVTYGLPVNSIAAANAIVNPNVIIVGQRITISGCGTTGAFPPATSTPFATLAPLGTGGFGNQTAGTGQVQTSTGVCGGQLIVQQYETLFEISLRCGVAVQSIANANGIVDINRINMGDILAIPAQ